MGTRSGASSSDENLYSRLARGEEPTRRTSLRGGEPDARGSSRSFLEPDEPTDDRDTRPSVPLQQFTEILAEIETARFALAVAFKKVLVGPLAIVQPELAELDAGPPEIDRVLCHVRSLEQQMRGSSVGRSSFYARDLPRPDRPAPPAAGTRLTTYASRGVRYLVSERRPARVGFAVAVSSDDCRALRIGDDGRMSYPFMMSIGVAPFIAMPLDGMLAAARENERRYRDHAGHGFHLPTFVEAYTDFFAFAIQDAPAALAALLLDERHPRAAEELLRAHDALTGPICAAALYFLGYEEKGGGGGPRLRRSLRDSEVARLCGMPLVEEIYDWRKRCCQGPLLSEFASGFRDLRVDKLASVPAQRGF